MNIETIIIKSLKGESCLSLKAVEICTLSPFLFNIVLDVLVTTIWSEKEVKAIQCGKGKNKTLPICRCIIVYKHNLKESIKKKKAENY